MGSGPIPATEKALNNANLTMDDIDYIELNEAFAAQSLYVIRKGGWDEKKININGGAISLGHPLGASGARIVATLSNVLKTRDATIGCASICNGGGGASSIVIERV